MCNIEQKQKKMLDAAKKEDALHNGNYYYYYFLMEFIFRFQKHTVGTSYTETRIILITK